MDKVEYHNQQEQPAWASDEQWAKLEQASEALMDVFREVNKTRDPLNPIGFFLFWSEANPSDKNQTLSSVYVEGTGSLLGSLYQYMTEELPAKLGFSEDE